MMQTIGCRTFFVTPGLIGLCISREYFHDLSPIEVPDHTRNSVSTLFATKLKATFEAFAQTIARLWH
jgi:hypothetical protein